MTILEYNNKCFILLLIYHITLIILKANNLYQQFYKLPFIYKIIIEFLKMFSKYRRERTI